MNPQPEPPSADESTSGAAGAAGSHAGDPGGPVDQPGFGSGATPDRDAAPANEADAASSESRGEGDYAKDDSSNDLDPNTGFPPSGTVPPAPQDAGTPDAPPPEPTEDAGGRDAYYGSPDPDAGVVNN